MVFSIWDNLSQPPLYCWFTKSTKRSTRPFPIPRRFSQTDSVDSPRCHRSFVRTELPEESARSRQHGSGWTGSRRRPTNQRVVMIDDRSHIPTEHFQSLRPSRTRMAAVCIETAYFEAMTLNFSGEGGPSSRTKSVVSAVGINNSAAIMSQVRSSAASARFPRPRESLQLQPLVLPQFSHL